MEPNPSPGSLTIVALPLQQCTAFLRERDIARLAEIHRVGITGATVSWLEWECFVARLSRRH